MFTCVLLHENNLENADDTHFIIDIYDERTL